MKKKKKQKQLNKKTKPTKPKTNHKETCYHRFTPLYTSNSALVVLAQQFIA